MTDYKTKALDHVRSVCPELMELSFGCKIEWDKEIGVISGFFYNRWYATFSERNLPPQVFQEETLEKIKIIGYTPHLEHWLRGIDPIRDEANISANGKFYISQTESGKTNWGVYDLTKDGENQSEEFYKAYCEIVGI
jgi:hypothetical protein